MSLQPIGLFDRRSMYLQRLASRSDGDERCVSQEIDDVPMKKNLTLDCQAGEQ